MRTVIYAILGGLLTLTIYLIWMCSNTLEEIRDILKRKEPK